MQTAARFAGQALRRRRLFSGLSQSELARKASLREQQINRWENDKNVPSADAVAILARALGCEIADLFSTGDESSDEDDEESDLWAAAQALDRSGHYAMAERLRTRARAIGLSRAPERRT